ncbi:MAG: glutamyl-tRNA reductase [Eubacteriales bacterium]|nr:glutamyl-tRNA reductase [Eubacteriales bacterium]
MRLRMLGIDHNLAPVDVRALFSFTRRQTEEFLQVLRKRPDVEGAVLLSTCNRTELYVSAGKPFVTDLYGMICKAKGQCADAYRDAWTHRSGMEAVRHLMELAAGLQSLIVGEDQILTQVKEALALARACYATDRVTEVLFRQAVTMAKQSKSLSRIDHGDPSCASQAIAQFRAMGEDFAGRSALVIGNGMMGRLTAQALLDAGAKVYVTVRQYHSGIVDIPQGAVRIGYGERYDYIPRCDFVFSATASPNLTIKKEALEACLNTPGCGGSQRQECGREDAWPQRGVERARIFVDLAVPRDIECSIDVLPGVKRYDIDDFASAKSVALQEQYRAVL